MVSEAGEWTLGRYAGVWKPRARFILAGEQDVGVKYLPRLWYLFDSGSRVP